MWMRSLLLWVVTAPALAGTATITWVAPTQRTDGSELTNLAGYHLFERCGTDAYGDPIFVPVQQVQLVRDGLPDGTTCYWQMTAIDAAGLESARTAEVSKTFDQSLPQLPDAPGSLVITWQASSDTGGGSPDMATVNRVQVAGPDNNFGPSPRSVTFGSAPTPGNLLVVIVTQRMEISAAGATIDGTGWTKQFSSDYLLYLSQHRSSVAVWTKVAGANEPSTITVTWPNASFSIVAAEYSHDVSGGEWSLAAKGIAPNGFYDFQTSWSQYVEADNPVAAGTNLVIGFVCWKDYGRNANVGTGGTFTSLDLGGLDSVSSNGHDMIIEHAWAQSDSAGTKATTYNSTGDGDDLSRAWQVGILVFSVEGGGGVDLAAAGSQHGVVSDSVTLTQGFVVASQDAVHAHTADSLSLTQASTIAALDSIHNLLVEGITLTQANVLDALASAHAHVSQPIVLTEAATLTSFDSIHAHASDSVGLSQSLSLSVDGSIHAHVSALVDLIQAALLGVESAAHGHAVDGATLAQATVLMPGGSVHVHTAELITLSEASLLSVVDAAHAHVADAVTVGVAGVLGIQDAVHAHVSNTASLIQAGVLVVDDSVHALMTAQVALSPEFAIEVADSIHAHTVSQPELTSAAALAVAAAAHLHAAGLVELSQSATLIVSDSIHQLISGAFSLIRPGQGFSDTLFVVQAEDRLYLVTPQSLNYIV